MFHPRLILAGLTTLALSALSPASLAAPRDPVRSPTAQEDAATDEAAKTRYAEGLRLFKKKKYEEARASFLQSTALKRRPAATLMLAKSSLNAGRWLEAAREFDAYSAEAGDVPPKLRALVEAGRREARSHLGRLRIEAPEGADVSIDGEHVPSLGSPIDVMPGPHTVVVTHRDEKKTETVEAPPGTTVDVRPSFVPKPLIPSNDTRTRPTPAPAHEPAPEDADQSESILAPPATTWPFYAAGAIGLGGLAAAAIFGGLKANASHAIDVATETLTRNGKSPSSCSSTTGWATAPDQKNDDEQKKFEETCATLSRNQSFARSHENLFAISLLIGLSGTALAAGWFFLAPKERREKTPTDGQPQIVPWLGASGGGATVQGRF
jgi:hypothetical protein